MTNEPGMILTAVDTGIDFLLVVCAWVVLDVVVGVVWDVVYTAWKKQGRK